MLAKHAKSSWIRFSKLKTFYTLKILEVWFKIDRNWRMKDKRSARWFEKNVI